MVLDPAHHQLGQSAGNGFVERHRRQRMRGALLRIPRIGQSLVNLPAEELQNLCPSLLDRKFAVDRTVPQIRAALMA
jgi:hypothetical protein